MDVELISQVCQTVRIPVVAHGGIGSPGQVLDVASRLPVSGIAIASMFHYHTITVSKDLDGFEEEGNIEFLKSNRMLSTIEAATIGETKNLLRENGIQVR